MRDQLVLRIVSKLLIPFILIFGLYILLHGKVSPGGGFQAGVIIAAAFIVYGFIFGARTTLQIISLRAMRIWAAIGVLIYAGTGLATLLMGGRLLEYNVFHSNPHTAQFIGIMVVETGIGITVTFVMLALFFTFAMHREDANAAIDSPDTVTGKRSTAGSTRIASNAPKRKKAPSSTAKGAN